MRDLKGKKVTILGIGVSGVESARFLRSQGAVIFVSEGRSTERTEKTAETLRQEGFEVEVGGHTEARIATSDLIIISPGISPKTPIYQFIQSKKIPLASEIEAASWFSEMPYVAVTGTNGKTTVTTLIAKMLSENGFPAIACGNIGNPFIGELKRINNEKLIPVIEVSSFQLMNIDSFRPHVGVLLNLDPDHLDWHADVEEYYDAKFSMFRKQGKSDFAVINRKDPLSLERLGRIPSQVVYFNEPDGFRANPNVDACLAVARIYQLDPERALASLLDFKGIDHRLEEVPSGDGRRYINDSKSTNISSLVWALERMERPAVVILGGKNKGGDFSRIDSLFRQKAKGAVLIGEATEEIARSLESVIPFTRAKTLEEAILLCQEKTRKGDTVLFSPGCASFDMFLNYKDRGEKFKKLVSELSHCPRPVSAS